MSHQSINRKLKPLFLPILAGILFLCGMSIFNNASEKSVPAAVQPAERTPIAFRTDTQTALSDAAADEKPILLFVTDEKCPFSRKMLHETFSDPEVKRMSQDFVCLKLDASVSEKAPLTAGLPIEGTPTVRFLSANGELIHQTARYQSADEMKQEMETVLHRTAWRQIPRSLW